MSNTFATSPAKRERALRMTNGGTSALLAVLCLAGAALARTAQHERLLAWLASQDQALMGRGVAGFDLSDLPWERQSFGPDRAFLQAVVTGARERLGWERLGYTPRIDEDLEAFSRLILDLEPTDVAWEEDRTPWLGWPEAIQRCPVHGVFQHAEGCLLCNDA
jgi:hypothetical protein